MNTTHTPPSAASPAPTDVYAYSFTARADGSVLALFTGTPADQAVAARAANLARTGRPVTAAAVVRSTGFSINALLHHARARRIEADTNAVLDAVLRVIARAGPVNTTSLVMPARVTPHQALPAGRVERAAERFDADLVLSPVPLTGHIPTLVGHLPAPPHRHALNRAAPSRHRHRRRPGAGRRAWRRLPRPAAASPSPIGDGTGTGRPS